MATIAATTGASGARRTGPKGGYSDWAYDRWVTPPAQNRSERTFYRFLDAAEGLLARRHWHEVSVQEIVRRAEASVGSFYNRFSDKMALLHCLDGRLGQECKQTIEALIGEVEANPDLAKAVPGIVVSMFMRLCTDRSGVIRALDMAQKMAEPDAFTGLGPKFDEAMDALASLLVSSHPDFARATPDAVAQAFRECFWLARESLLYHPSDRSADQLHGLLLRHFHAAVEM